MTYNTHNTHPLQKLAESVIESAAKHKHDLTGFGHLKAIEEFILNTPEIKARYETCMAQSKQVGKLAYDLRQKGATEAEIKTELDKLKATFTDGFGRLSNHISMEYCISIGLQKRRCYETDVRIDKKYVERLEAKGQTEKVAAYKAQVKANAEKLKAIEQKKAEDVKADDDFAKLLAEGKLSL